MRLSRHSILRVHSNEIILRVRSRTQRRSVVGRGVRTVSMGTRIESNYYQGAFSHSTTLRRRPRCAVSVCRHAHRMNYIQSAFAHSSALRRQLRCAECVSEHTHRMKLFWSALAHFGDASSSSAMCRECLWTRTSNKIKSKCICALGDASSSTTMCGQCL